MNNYIVLYQDQHGMYQQYDANTDTPAQAVQQVKEDREEFVTLVDVYHVMH